jgi:hypothetical protein
LQGKKMANKKNKLRFRALPKSRAWVELGTADTLVISEGDKIHTFKFPATYKLLAHPGGKMLLLAYVTGRKKRSDQNLRAEQLYLDWSGFEPVTFVAKIPSSKKLSLIGRAESIIYRSDKWSGQTQRYIHDFKNPPLAWGDGPNKPQLILLTGGRVRVTERGIVG